MNTVETILVILLSVGFLVLLTLSIIIASLLIAIIRRMNRITQKAELATNNLSDAAAKLSSKIAPVALTTILGFLTKKFKSRKGDE